MTNEEKMVYAAAFAASVVTEHWRTQALADRAAINARHAVECLRAVPVHEDGISRASVEMRDEFSGSSETIDRLRRLLGASANFINAVRKQRGFAQGGESSPNEMEAVDLLRDIRTLLEET